MHGRTRRTWVPGLTATILALAGCRALDGPRGEPLRVQAEYYVATDGNDAWSGRLPRPNAERTDGPFATVSAARDTIRRSGRAGGRAGPLCVVLRGGTYRLSEPLVFTPEDSGTEQSPITYLAHPGEQVILSGGREVTGWCKVGRGLWATHLPEVKEDAWGFRRLYVDGERRTLARTPNDGGFYRIRGKAPAVPGAEPGAIQASSKIAFQFAPGDIGSWLRLRGANAVVLRNWESAILPIASVDEETDTVVFTGPMKWELRTGLRYYLEDLYEALDAPGEWYLDRTTGTLYYRPMRGERPGRTPVIAPVVTQLLLLQGEPEKGRFVEHLTFRGLSFRHTDYPLEPTGHSDWQAAVTVPAAIQATGARSCTITDCEIANIGMYAIWFERGCTDNRIEKNELRDMGAGGIRIGEPGVRQDEADRTARNVVHNNFIHDGGSVYYGAIPVWIGQSSDNVVSHNEICDFNYTGISVGWSWGFHPTTCHRNVIEYNHLHHLGRGMLYDMAAIYTLGISTGTRISHNHIHHIWDWVEGYGAGGIYPDEGSTGILIENNVVYATTAGGLTVHYGRDNIARNNIFALGRDAQIHLGRSDKESSLTFEHNIVYYEQGELFRRKSTLTADRNVYFNARGKPVRFLGGLDLAGWQAEGHDTHSLVTDPRFVDPKHFDFRLRPDSPALRLGFKPIDISKAGLVGDPEWVDRPKRIRRAGTAIPAKRLPPPLRLDDGFEQSLVGTTANVATTHGETTEATIRVTDELAARGKQSLKFTDARGLDQPWNPHLHYLPNLAEGVLTCSYDLRLQPGAIVWHEWRSAGHPYVTGPSLSFGSEGTLKAGDTVVTKLPMQEWVHIEIRCGVGRKATGTYDLTVTVPGQTPVMLREHPCDPAFDVLGWLGFVSNATEPTVFHLDNVRLRSAKR